MNSHMPANGLASKKWKSSQERDVPRLNNNLNQSIMNKGIESAGNFPSKSSSRQPGFRPAFYQTFKTIICLSQILPENWREESTFMFDLWGEHYPDTKAKDATRKLYVNISEEHKCGNSWSYYYLTLSNSTLKGSSTDMVFIPGIQRWFSI